MAVGNSLTDFLTEYDDSLAKDSARDPLGTQIIWSYFGQKLFGKMVTTIANDIRNYSINLFNHYVVKNILEEDSFQLKNEALKIFGSKHSPEFQRALIIFLENLITYSILIDNKEGDSPTIETRNMLGSLNAADRIERYKGNPPLIFHENAGILIRQFSLGVNGRYKGPFIVMKIFDSQFHNKDLPEELINETFPELSDLLTNGIKTLLNSTKLQKKPDDDSFMELSREDKFFLCFFQDITAIRDIQRLCKTYFGNYKVVQNLKNFWLEKLGFLGDDIKNIYNAIEQNYNVHSIISNLQLDENEAIQDIRIIEPILSSASYLFESFLTLGVKNKEDLEILLKKHNFIFNKIKSSLKLGEAHSIIRREGEQTMPQRRLKALIEVFKQNNLEDGLKKLQEYHSNIMKIRLLPDWISLDKNKINRLPGIRSHETLNNFDKTQWSNDYYLRTILNIKRGLDGDIS